MQWNVEPLWQLFEAHGVDVATMTPRPLEGPVVVVPSPELPDPAPDQEPSVWAVTKAANRLARKIAQAEVGTIAPKPWYAQDAAGQLASAKRLLSDVRQAIASRSMS